MSAERTLLAAMTTRDLINRRVYASGLNVLAMLLVAGLLELVWKATDVTLVGAITIGALFGHILCVGCTRCLNCAQELGLPALWWQLGAGADISHCPHCKMSIDRDLSQQKG
jgi:hypothetical protein